MKRLYQFVALAICLLHFTFVQAEQWIVPLAGNAFRSEPTSRARDFQRDGTLTWSDSEAVFSVFVRVNRPASLDLALKARSPGGQTLLSARVLDEEYVVHLDGADWGVHPIGRVVVDKVGYFRIDLQGTERSSSEFGEIRDFEITSDTDGLELDYVKTNEGNMFYWGRRGPSVHLRYTVPQERPLQYAYSEITVDPGQDPIGSYFMANGFGEGYFGVQVNSAEERRVLFSVWSPYKTDNPQDIPEDHRIVAVARGPDVRVGEFGNEGSGGQSFLVYPWKAGTTYRFLTEVTPDEQGNTTYTSWFGDKAEREWRLIASFRRPKTNTHLRGFHSFLENFVPTYGHKVREGLHGNVWVRDVDGDWHECIHARFSVDATGGGRHRLDFVGGSNRGHFFLRNGGFFDEPGKPGETFTRESTANEKPDIDFASLPRM